MTEDSDAAGQAAFEQSIFACMQDLDALLPDLASRYDRTVIISAMAEHVGSALLALRRKKVCDDRQTELAIQHIERAAFDLPPGGAAQDREPREGEPSQD